MTARTVRAALAAYGWVLRRSPRYNREAGEYSAYIVYDPHWSRVVLGDPFGTSLDAISEWLDTLPCLTSSRRPSARS